MIDTHLHHEVASYYERKSPKAHRRMQRRRTSTYFKSRWGRISIRSYRPEILIKSLGPNLTFFSVSNVADLRLEIYFLRPGYQSQAMTSFDSYLLAGHESVNSFPPLKQCQAYSVDLLPSVQYILYLILKLLIVDQFIAALKLRSNNLLGISGQSGQGK